MTDEAKRIVAGLRNFSMSDTVEYANEIVSNARKAAVLIESLFADLERVTRERDAAVEDLEILSDCETCLHNDDEACEHCCDIIVRGNWQWRGAKE